MQQVFASRCRVVVEVTPPMVKPITGKCTINYCQYEEDVGCVCMLNDWISSNDEICADNYNYFRFSS